MEDSVVAVARQALGVRRRSFSSPKGKQDWAQGFNPGLPQLTRHALKGRQVCFPRDWACFQRHPSNGVPGPPTRQIASKTPISGLKPWA